MCELTSVLFSYFSTKAYVVDTQFRYGIRPIKHTLLLLIRLVPDLGPNCLQRFISCHYYSKKS